MRARWRADAGPRRAFGVLALLLLSAAAAAPAGNPPPAEYLQAVEFPYYLYPRALWERELVWLKNIGIRSVEFSIPWNWHQLAPGDFDFSGRTSPRRDLLGLIRILRRLASTPGCAVQSRSMDGGIWEFRAEPMPARGAPG